MKTESTTETPRTQRKTFEVTIKAFASVVLEAETEAEAGTIACEETRLGDFQPDSWSAEILTTPSEIASAKRHADKVVDL